MIIYITAPHSNWFRNANDEMNIYLAALWSENNRSDKEGDFNQRIFVLESFYYVKPWMKPYIQDKWAFILDSGAFTFMAKAEKNIDWDEYVERYAAFINEMGVELFFELDIDVLVGLKEVERLRAKLEALTGKQSIPVWHKSRGKEYWLKLCDEYGYVALGGMAADAKYRKQIEPFFPWFINEANKRNAKVHALGYTVLDGLKKYRFHSVDGTAWLYGNRGGFVWCFNGETMVQYKKKGSRIINEKLAIHNFKEWVKFQKYAEHNL